jgi:hypothetical protein
MYKLYIVEAKKLEKQLKQIEKRRNTREKQKLLAQIAQVYFIAF